MTEQSFDPSVLPKIKEWAQGFDRPMTVLDFIMHSASIDMVYALASVFWPKFICVRGCILVPWAYEETAFEQWWSQCNGKVNEIEAVVNHRHLWDLFPSEHTEDAVVIQAYREVGKTLANAWRQRLAEQFPDTRFEVYYDEDEYEYGPTVGVRRADTN